MKHGMIHNYVNNSNDIDVIVEGFIGRLTTHIDNQTISKKISHKNKPIKKWITQGLVNSMQEIKCTKN